MNFLVDAQLPRRMAHEIVALGDDAVHTLDLPAGNLTPDSAITKLAIAEARVVITKDSDFVDRSESGGCARCAVFFSNGDCMLIV